MRTSLTDLSGIQYPIIQAPIGSATTPELAAAVSNAGGLGTLALSWKEPEEMREMIRKTKHLTSNPFAVNLVLAFEQTQRVKICVEEKVPIVSFFWGDSTEFYPELKRNHILIAQTVSNADEAVYFESKGADFLIAQGWEAGGHVRGTVATSILIPAIADKVSIPVVATGGIADGRGFLAALGLGAAGICLGTRFLMSEEAGVDPLYQELIRNASENDTYYADRLFNIGWDHAPHRVIKNSTVTNWMTAGRPPAGQRPGEHEVIAFYPGGTPIERYSDIGPMQYLTGDLEALALYAGQSAGLLTEVQGAASIISSLVNELESALARINSSLLQ